MKRVGVPRSDEPADARAGRIPAPGPNAGHNSDIFRQEKLVSEPPTDNNGPPVTTAERALVILLRIIGVSGLFAIPAIFLPYSSMNAIHAMLGLGELPKQPIVGYLARSLSSFYAAVSAMILFVSFDVRRYRAFLGLWGVLFAVMGAVTLGIDLAEGMPASWTWSEGPPSIAVGLLVIWLQKRVPE